MSPGTLQAFTRPEMGNGTVQIIIGVVAAAAIAIAVSQQQQRRPGGYHLAGGFDQHHGLTLETRCSSGRGVS
jgi:bifunctional DNase/RNase